MTLNTRHVRNALRLANCPSGWPTHECVYFEDEEGILEALCFGDKAEQSRVEIRKLSETGENRQLRLSLNEIVMKL